VIERSVFADPWSSNDFAECVSTGVLFLVADERGAVVGYVVARSARDEGEILNLGVAGAHRRRGIGRRLVERALARLEARGVQMVYLEVRESNAVARELYRSLGFAEVGRRGRYYNHPVEDAVILRAALRGARAAAKL
jgi:[ribosomal protein S18]-alanine N-acetyltransferase